MFIHQVCEGGNASTMVIDEWGNASSARLDEWGHLRITNIILSEESVVSSDQLGKSSTKLLSDGVTSSDSIMPRSLMCIRTEVACINDSCNKYMQRYVADYCRTHDMVAKTPGKIIDESIDVIDNISRHPIIECIEEILGTEVLRRHPRVIKHDNGIVEDERVTRIERELADIGYSADEVKRHPLLLLYDGEVPSDDTIYRTVSLYREELCNTNDLLRINAGKTFNEYSTIVDSYTRKIAINLLDRIDVFEFKFGEYYTEMTEWGEAVLNGMTEWGVEVYGSVRERVKYVGVIVGKNISDGVEVIDGNSKDLFRNINEGVEVSEGIGKGVGRIVNDGVSGDEEVGREVDREIWEVVGIDEENCKGVSKGMSEDVGVEDGIEREIGKVVDDGVGIGDGVEKGIERNIGEEVSIGEISMRGVERVVDEEIGVSDGMGRLIGKNVGDGMSIAERIERVMERSVEERIRVVEGMYRDVEREYSEMVDSLEKMEKGMERDVYDGVAIEEDVGNRGVERVVEDGVGVSEEKTVGLMRKLIDGVNVSELRRAFFGRVLGLRKTVVEGEERNECVGDGERTVIEGEERSGVDGDKNGNA